MRIGYLLPPFVALLLTNCAPGLRPMGVYLQNRTARPVTARLRYGGGEQVDLVRTQIHFFQGLRYAPRLVRPRDNMKRFRSTVPVSAADTAVAFVLPPRSTVLLYITPDRSAPEVLKDGKLYLQPAGAAMRVLPAERLWQEGRFRRGGGFWYTIE